MDESSFVNPVVVVHVHAAASGAIAAVAQRSASRDVIEQTWLRGRVCASCGHGTLGPDRAPQACDDAIP
jgi:hypothetical protein